jgi:hypothetical protein
MARVTVEDCIDKVESLIRISIGCKRKSYSATFWNEPT